MHSGIYCWGIGVIRNLDINQMDPDVILNTYIVDFIYSIQPLHVCTHTG